LKPAEIFNHFGSRVERGIGAPPTLHPPVAVADDDDDDDEGFDGDEFEGDETA